MEAIMATCYDCGKKINRFFNRCNLIEGQLICAVCDDKRKGREKVESKETLRLDFERELTTGDCKR